MFCKQCNTAESIHLFLCMVTNKRNCELVRAASYVFALVSQLSLFCAAFRFPAVARARVPLWRSSANEHSLAICETQSHVVEDKALH